MGTKRGKARTSNRVDLHLSVDRDVASRFRAFCGHHGRGYGDVFSEAVRAYTRGFSVHVRAGEGVCPPTDDLPPSDVVT